MVSVRKSLTSRLMSAAIALALALPVFVPAPAMAAASFTGGPMSDNPTYVPNDHTPVALRWGASGVTGLAANTTYYYKLRMSPVAGTGQDLERGFTWNPQSGQWVMGRDADWTAFPTVQTNDSGEIADPVSGLATDVWSHFKFGDDTASGTYYLFVSLSTGAQGTTLNSNNGSVSGTWPITVLDMKTNGTRMHNGTAAAGGSAASKRVEVTAWDTTSTIYSLSRTETNTVDDDSNGVIDDENFGPAGSKGDWWLSAPSATKVDVYYQRSTSKAADFMTKNADEDIAIGAADTTAPVAPANLEAVAGEKQADLTWDASTDDIAVDHYDVYRWSPLLTQLYTPVHEKIASVPADTLSYTDATAVIDGQEYNYEIRAIDAAGNVSARSTSAMIVGQATVDPAVVETSGAVAQPDGWFLGAAPTITLTSPDSVKYSWDDPLGVFGDYSAPLTAPDGTHTLYFYTVDAYGNVGAAQSRVFKVDLVAPVVTSAVTPTAPSGANGWYVTAPAITLSSSDRVEYAWDTTASGFMAYSTALTAPVGTHTLYFRAVDTTSGYAGETQSLQFKVDAQAPSASVSTPAYSTRTGTKASFKVSWSGKDASPSSGGLTYDVEYKISAKGSWKRWKSATSATSATKTATKGNTYYFRVRSRDAAGNLGAWSATHSTVVPYDNSSLRFTRSFKTSKSSKYFYGSEKYSTVRGAYARYSFKGAGSLYLIAKKTTKSGKVKVYVDGKYLRTVSLKSGSTKYRQDIYLGKTTSTKTHTVKLVNALSRKRVDVDGLAVRR